MRWFRFFYGAALAIFTAFILLDTFVLREIYTVTATETEAPVIQKMPEEAADPALVVKTETRYQDENITITLSEFRQNDSTIYAADVRIASPEYLKTAFAENAYGKNVTQKTSEIAQANQAILAINGDFYGSRERGYVLRDGVLFRETTSRAQEDLVIWEDGSFSVITEEEITAGELLESGARQILSFGPALIRDGAICVTAEDEVGKAKANNPRTAIGIIEPLHYLLVVADGRTEESEGLSLLELAECMQSLGAELAYNLDGGGSSTMYFNGNVVNRPTSSGKSIKERKVSDIVYIGY